VIIENTSGDLPKHDLDFIENYVDNREAADLRAELDALIDTFQVEQIRKGTEWSPTPRLVASFSDEQFALPGARPSLPVPDRMRRLCESVAEHVGHPINYVLANWYRNGSDHTGWHCDKVEFHEPETRIAVLSLGATRPFVVRDLISGRIRSELNMSSGSLAVMSMHLQTYAEHCVPAVAEEIGPRISLTLRCLRRA
jgi:alkylated DNA repair dioxygenase AlkB